MARKSSDGPEKGHKGGTEAREAGTREDKRRGAAKEPQPETTEPPAGSVATGDLPAAARVEAGDAAEALAVVAATEVDGESASADEAGPAAAEVWETGTAQSAREDEQATAEAMGGPRAGAEKAGRRTEGGAFSAAGGLLRRGVYSAFYYSAYSLTFGSLALANLIPNRSAVAEGVRDGARDARRDFEGHLHATEAPDDAGAAPAT